MCLVLSYNVKYCLNIKQNNGDKKMTKQEANKKDFLGQAEFFTNPTTGLTTAKIKIVDWDDWGNFEMTFKTVTITD